MRYFAFLSIVLLFTSIERPRHDTEREFLLDEIDRVEKEVIIKQKILKDIYDEKL